MKIDYYTDASMRRLWISVEDRFPENGSFFLAFGKDLGMSTIGPEIDICRYDGMFWDEGGTEICSAKITHWMPLPEPPE